MPRGMYIRTDATKTKTSNSLKGKTSARKGKYPKRTTINCAFCSKKFFANIHRKYCSQSCSSKNGNFGPLEKHENWKGDKIGYWGIHKWINRHYGQPKKCENCKKDNLVKRQIHWANISHKYKRDITDWIRLCQSCHRNYDNGKLTLNKITGII